ncbi:MAG TPA: 50S ribosome-binding GTPase, partial [Clostridiales bacterium]|nr:50S ribosome-binding GTPase [Clostridiales bacterium]
GGGLKQFMTVLRSVSAPIKERNAQKGMPGKTITVLVAGIPNTGKSSFINRMAGKAKAKVEDRAGVTRQNQRYTIDKGIDMIDTPGLLWPKFEDPAVGDKLAFTGGIKDTILDIETLAARLLTVLAEICPEKLTARYKLEDTSGHSGFELLEMLGRKRGMLLSGNEVDTERAANTLLDEFRGGKLGRISLEVPTDSMEDENDKP